MAMLTVSTEEWKSEEVDDKQVWPHNLDLDYQTGSRIFKWMSSLPPDCAQFADPETAPEWTADVYKDNLNWIAGSVELLQKELEKHEGEYRGLGLTYHELPLLVRSSTSDVFNSRTPSTPVSSLLVRSPAPITTSINPAILHSLSIIFDTDQLRPRHQFFTNWHNVEETLTECHRRLSLDYTNLQGGQLQTLLKVIEYDCDMASKLLTHIATQIEGVSRSVDAVKSRSNGPQKANLEDAFSVEGSSYRRWVSTFPEVVAGDVELDVAQRVLRDGGPEASVALRGGQADEENEANMACRGGQEDGEDEAGEA